MCGIAGYINKGLLNNDVVISKMTQKIHHRGPDSSGSWEDVSSTIVMGHTRLSILDLSSSGSQPMESHSGRYIIVFNGEIYNNSTLKKKLETEALISWRGHSDTEIFLEAIEKLGIEETLALSNGMFAFALWDKESRNLLLARDRMGEKPLYYGTVNDHFVFSSDLAAIEAFPGFQNKINKNALALYLRHSAIPAPYSIYEGIKKLSPGSFITLTENQFNNPEVLYYDIKELYNNEPFELNDKEAIQKLNNLISNAVALQMQADVPTGAFLSGGIDSSTIAAIMQNQSSSSISTFSIGFDVKKYNEAEHARKVAKHLNTNHHDLYVTEKEVLDVIPSLPSIYSEPFSDSSQIPTYLVSKIAKEKVTVCLTGDAGDELFCGYSRYQLASNSWNRISKIPLPLRKAAKELLKVTPDALLKPILGSKGTSTTNKLDKLYKALDVIDSKSRLEFYSRAFLSHNEYASSIVLGSHVPLTVYNSNLTDLDLGSYYSEMMLLDLLSYLPTDNLAKVDRASMAVSLETRVPLLDKNIIDFAVNLPIDFKLRNGVDKWILKQVLYDYVPKDLIERPKMGFAVPLNDWIKGPLKEWGADLLAPDLLKDQAIFDWKLVQKMWLEHHSGKRNWQYQLWDLMNFQSWYFSRR